MAEVQHVYPYLRVRAAAEAIVFYTRAFGAAELFRLTEPSGRIGHAELKLGESTLMLSDEFPGAGLLGPLALGGTSVALHLHVDDVDSLFAQAVGAGASVIRPLQDQFYGERMGVISDPFGHRWMLGGHVETVTPQEMQRRYNAMFSE
jgi:uncharacterized glyoxalase superfamily protein PhnB